MTPAEQAIVRNPRAHGLPLWARLLYALQLPWVKLRIEQPDDGEGFDPAKRYCYVLEREGLSYTLILEQACREAGLPGPFVPPAGLRRRCATFALTRRRFLPFGRRDRAVADTATLEELVRRAAADPAFDCQLVPVSVFVGRAPDRNQGWFRVLFSEHWAITGWFQRALALIFNGRNTWVRYARPVSLRELLAEGQAPSLATRKLARVLRTHFRRVRTAMIGPFLRRGGAFFIRRSFKGNALYPVVFAEYVDALFANGTAIEYFIEGGRSRTGRLLAPKAGMLAMTVRSFLRTPQQPAVFVPVYIGYEKLIEGGSYLGELAGKSKRKESVGGLLRSLGVLRNKYGQAAVSFGEPIDLRSHLDACAPQWRGERTQARAEWLNPAVDSLAERIQVEVNRAAEVNAVNLIALAILGAPKHALGEADLIAQIRLFKAVFTQVPYGPRVVVTEQSPEEIIAYGEKLGWLRRIPHPLGDVLSAEGDQGILLSYYRNNVLHLAVCAAWIACCFLNNREMSRASIARVGRIVYPFLKAELFLPWEADEFTAELEKTADVLVDQRVLDVRDDGRRLRRPSGGTQGQYQLRLLAHSLLQTIERYYIAAAVLVRSGSGTLTAIELENLCHLTAQRLSLLQELSGPEFFDKALFRGFIQQLRELGVATTNADGKLVFDETLIDAIEDAKRILSREIRHGILKLTPEARAVIEGDRP